MKAQARKSGQTQTENRQGQSEKADCPCRIARCKTRVQYGRMRTTNRSFDLT